MQVRRTAPNRCTCAAAPRVTTRRTLSRADAEHDDQRVVFWLPDSQRFLYVARQDEAIPRTINIVLDWPVLLNAPARRTRMSECGSSSLVTC